MLRFCDVDLPGVAPASARVSVSEESTPKVLHVREESENVVDTSVAVSSTELVSVSEETSMDADGCEKSEIEVDVFVVADIDSLQNNPGKDAVPSEPNTPLTDTEPGVVTRSPEVGLEDHVIQIRVESESGTNVGGLEGKAHGGTEHGGVKGEVFVDGAIGSCAGRKVVEESTAELPAVMFACLKSECLSPTSGPVLAAPDGWL